MVALARLVVFGVEEALLEGQLIGGGLIGVGRNKALSIVGEVQILSGTVDIGLHADKLRMFLVVQ